MLGELYEKCPICQGSGIALDQEKHDFTTKCHGCQGERYRLFGINVAAIQQMIEDAQEAHRYYQADGTAIHVESADEVRYLRVQCAKKIESLKRVIHDAGLPSPEDEVSPE
jgi:hypothetical protein